MCHHTHLTLSEREDIMIMRREGRKITEIAEAIGRSKSTVSRELRRNLCQRFYRACLVTLVDRKSGYLVGGKCARKASDQVNKVYDKINRRPRKRLGYRTPYEAHYDKSLHLR